MALPDLTNQNIQDTYQRVVQKDTSGQLLDGTGSALPIKVEGNNIRISGSLIAQQYIVSSSVTNITTLQLSGSTEFGDSTDDTHTFLGYITASGEISASGQIFGDQWVGNGTVFPDFNTNSLAKIQANASGVTINQGLSVDNTMIGGVGNITASGNISASGEITSDRLKVLGTVPSVITSGLTIGSDSPTNVNLLVDGNSRFESHITASGNISASGNITMGDSLYMGINDSQPFGRINIGGLDYWNMYSGQNYSFQHIKIGNTKQLQFGANGIFTMEFTTVGDDYWRFQSGSTDLITVPQGQHGNHITIHPLLAAQGDISASGDILGTSFNALNGSTNGYKMDGISLLYRTQNSFKLGPGGQGVSGDIILSSSNITLNAPVTTSGNISSSRTSTIFGGSGSFHHLIGDTTQDTGLLVLGAITASAGISASGNIYADKIYSDSAFYSAGYGVLGTDGVTTTVAKTGLKTHIDGTNIYLDGPVTASGNISASGYIYAGGDIHAVGDVVASSTTPSDYRLKTNIKPINSPLEKILSLEGKEFEWKTTGNSDFGLIAQDVEKIIPRLVKEKNILGVEETRKVVNYISIVPLLIESIKELNDKIEDLKNGK